MTEYQLDQIREGKIPIQFGDDGLPIGAHEPIFELMRFVSALARGYMRLYNNKKNRDRMERARR